MWGKQRNFAENGRHDRTYDETKGHFREPPNPCAGEMKHHPLLDGCRKAECPKSDPDNHNRDKSEGVKTV